MRICDLHHGDPFSWSASTSYIICVMLNKKCALPIPAIDAAVKHFASFISDSRELPVVWHQSLLTLVQRYKCKLTLGEWFIASVIYYSHFVVFVHS